MKATIFTLFTAIFLTGCASSRPGGEFQKAPFDADAPTYVKIPPDPTFEGDKYPGSGVKFARMVSKEMGRKFTDLRSAPGPLTDDEAFQKAAATGCRYLIDPIILHWEDRATQWSGMLDHVTFCIQISDVATREAISSVTVQCQNSWFTFVNDPPEVMLPQPIHDYVDTLKFENPNNTLKNR